MRISSQQIFGRGLQDIQSLTSKLQQTQAQVSSGKKLQTPSDDPAAAARVLELTGELSKIGQYKQNITVAENRLQQEDGVLEGANEILHRLTELTVQSGDGALNAKDREYIAAEIRQRTDQLRGLANTRDANGEYIFAGYQGFTEPFVKEPVNRNVYRGDEGQRYVQIDASVRIPATDHGKGIFHDVADAETGVIVSPAAANSTIPGSVVTQGEVVDREAFDAFYPRDLVMEINEPGARTPPGPNYTLRDADSGEVLRDAFPFDPGQPITVAGVSFEVRGDPQPGDAWTLQSSEKQGVLTTMDNLVVALESYTDTPEGREAYTRVMTETLANIDNAETEILNTRAEVGARLNTLDTTRELHRASEVQIKKVVAELEEVDMTEAISKLSQQSTLLQAAQQSYARISGLSLFDYL